MVTLPNNDSLAHQLAAAQLNPGNWPAVLAALASATVLTLLHQPPGEGDAAPWRNLVKWRYAVTGQDVALVFTGPDQFPHAPPPPAVLVRVPMRQLLSITGHPPLVINPLSESPWLLTTDQCLTMRAVLAGQGLSTEQPRPEAPWAFRHAADDVRGIAEALASLLHASEDIDTAYLYCLTRPEVQPDEVLVLGVDTPADPRLAARLAEAARRAGAADSFLIRFLPDEPSHRAAVDGMPIKPFFRRLGKAER